MAIVVIGTVFVDIKGFPFGQFIPTGRNAGSVEIVHGGVARNVCEDISNVELRPLFVSLVDDNGNGTDVIDKLNRHKINTKFVKQTKDGMGTWLAVFDNDGDVAASISKRPDTAPITDILIQNEEEIFKDADAIVLEIDMEKDVVKQVFASAEKYNKPVYAVISNMSIALERRDFFQKLSCFVCNIQEAGLLFMENYDNCDLDEMENILKDKVISAGFKSMVVTMGAKGSVYADAEGTHGSVPSIPVQVVDTTGAGDAFCAGLSIGLAYGKTLEESCKIGTKLASSVIITKESVCPRFRPEEFGLKALP